jgi:hypothetical protein
MPLKGNSSGPSVSVGVAVAFPEFKETSLAPARREGVQRIGLRRSGARVHHFRNRAASPGMPSGKVMISACILKPSGRSSSR